jgi:hypothetical protein
MKFLQREDAERRLGLGAAESSRVLGYERVRQNGSHIRLTTQLDGEYHVTVPKNLDL